MESLTVVKNLTRRVLKCDNHGEFWRSRTLRQGSQTGHSIKVLKRGTQRGRSDKVHRRGAEQRGRSVIALKRGAHRARSCGTTVNLCPWGRWWCGGEEVGLRTGRWGGRQEVRSGRRKGRHPAGAPTQEARKTDATVKRYK